MPTVILLDVKYLQNVVFSFDRGLNGENHSSSDSPPPDKKISHSKISYPYPILGGVSPLSLNAIWKTLEWMTTKTENFQHSVI